MGFDGFLVPDWAKPYVGWVVGMDWPEGDETGCFRLADACVVAAHQLVEGTLADLPSSTNKIGSEWDGDAHLAFAQHVSEVAGGKVADLVTRLINTAIALNGVGVQIQYAKYMIEATVWLLIVQIAYLLAAAMASGGASLALIPPRVALARLTVAQIAKRTLLNIALFAGIVAGMDGGIQALQMAQGRRDELDARQLVVSALSGGAMGGLMGLLSGGLSRLATPALRAGLSRAEMTTAEKLLSAASSSLYGQAAQYALTGGITTAGTLLAEGNFSWEMLAKGITSSALGADGQHLTTTLPRGGGDPPPPHRTSGEGNPSSGPPPPSPSQADPPPGSHTPSTPKGDPPSPHPGPASTSDTSGPAGAAPGHPLNQINTNVTELAAHAPAPPGESVHHAQNADSPVGTKAHTSADQGGTPKSGTDSPGVLRSTDPVPAPRTAGERSDAGTPRQAADRGDGSTPRQAAEQSAGGTPRHGSNREEPGTARPEADGKGPGTTRQAADGDDGASTRRAADRDGADTTTHAAGRGAGDPSTQATGRGDSDPSAGTSRIERLLNHDGDPVPPSRLAEASTQTAHAGDVTPLRGEGDPLPPLRPAGESASHARVPDGAWNTTRAPFDFERFYNDPRWSADATRFEQRLGAYYFNNPETLDAARTALRKMRDVLLELTPRRSDESVEDFTRRVESVFFKDDLASAGQVGKRDVTLDDLLAHGNLRELVTAFYNGAYYNRENPHILGNALLDIMDNNRWNAARDAGLDVGEIRRSQHQLDERMHRPIIGRAEAMFMSDSNTFTRDPFGTGNVGMMSQRGVRDVSEMVSSQHSRRTRTDEEIQELGLHTTPEHYEGLGTPLGKFERAYIEEATQRKLDPDTPLPWREGATMHDLPSSRWAQKTSSAGFLVVDGVSGTTAKMLTAVKFLDLGPKTTEHFLGALMGWMLPGRDHSLFEVAKGAQIAGVGWMPLEPGTRPTAVDFYRNLPNIDLGTLRREVLPDGMFPHEARYYMNATDKAGFTETQPSHIRGIADRLWPQLESGRVTDQSLWRWLERNGVDPTNVDQVRALGERLSPAHLMAMTVYTESSHSLINHVARTQLWTAGLSESVVHRRLADKIHQAVTAYLDNMAGGQRSSGYIPAVVHSALYPSGRSSLHERAQAYVDAARRADEATKALAEHRAEGRKEEARQAGKDLREARRERQEALNDVKMQLGKGLTRLFDEMRWHVDMVHDAMMQLPAVGTPDRPVLAYRGDWLTPVHSPIYGSKWHPHGTAREFLSTSLSLEVAVRFMLDNPAGDRKVLVVYQLTGQQARDISVFSAYASEKEAVLPPRSRTEWVRDQEQVEGVRADVERVITDMVNRRSLSEPPDYEIIVMREAPGDG